MSEDQVTGHPFHGDVLDKVNTRIYNENTIKRHGIKYTWQYKTNCTACYIELDGGLDMGKI